MLFIPTYQIYQLKGYITDNSMKSIRIYLYFHLFEGCKDMDVK